MSPAMSQAEEPRPMRADARRNHERIVAVAREVFAEQGADAPMDDVGKRAKVGAGTLYRHFPSREALIEAVYRDDVHRLSKLAYDLLAERSPDDALAEWVREHIAYRVSNGGLAATLKAAMRESEAFLECKTLLRDAADALLAPAKDSGRIRADVQGHDLLLLSHGVGTAAEHASPEETERLISVMLAGLRR